MTDDRDLARRALDFQERAKEYALTSLPGYMAWSEERIAQGESEALIAHLDATTMILLPEDIGALTDADYDGLLDDLKAGLDRPSRSGQE